MAETTIPKLELDYFHPMSNTECSTTPKEFEKQTHFAKAKFEMRLRPCKGAEKFTFYQIPKVFFTDDRFSPMSTDSKVLYGVLLGRSSLSVKNNFIDSENRVFFYYSIEELIDVLHFGRNKIIKLLNELKEIGLLECKRQGLNKPNIYYLKDFSEPVDCEKEPEKPENCQFIDNNKCIERHAPINGPVQCTRKFENQTSRSLKNKLQEVPKSNSNNTDNKKNDNNYYYARARNPKKNSFYFENQRDYDYDELERMIVNKSFPGIPRNIEKAAVP